MSRPTLELAKEKNMDLYLAERELLGFDYAQVGAELMREWALPESLIEKIEFQNEPDRADLYQLEAALLHIATVMAKAVIAKEEVSSDTLAINPICWEVTGLTPQDIPEIRLNADQHVVMAMDLLIAKTKSA